MSQLLATTLVMMEKDKEILKLKAELARQQNSAKQQKEFQEQIEQMIVQKEAERSALKSQVQQLKTRFLQKYYPNMFINGPSGDQNILAIESTDTLDNYIDNIDPTFDNEHNSSISDYTDIKQTGDNNDIGNPNESKTETIDDNMQDQTDNIDNEDQDNSKFESKEIIQTDNNTLNSQLTSMTIILQWKPKLKLTIVTKSLSQLKVKMKMTLNPLNLKALTLILTLMLAQSMTLKILKP